MKGDPQEGWMFVLAASALEMLKDKKNGKCLSEMLVTRVVVLTMQEG